MKTSAIHRYRPDSADCGGENPEYLSEQIITYLGNKRALLAFIGRAVNAVRRELGRERLSMLDVFSGTGIVSRYFKRFASRLYVNDLESYCRLISSCYLANRSGIDMALLEDALADLKCRVERNLHGGFITELYAPRDEAAIRKGERVFYTIRNAMLIDTARQEIALMPEDLQKFFLGPLIYGASVHNNTCGVFKGFYKNSLGIGQYGGSGRNALTRIKGDIELTLPVFSNYCCDYQIFQKDALDACLEMPEEVDLAYLDPPYNQHPYGSNYFMLNLILDYKRPRRISAVSGIPSDWRHSKYNSWKHSQETLFRLVEIVRAKYILVSYNSEGFVEYDDFVSHLSGLGRLDIMSVEYNAYRASRNLGDREIHVREYLFLLKRG